jgi:hypothetical protein
MLAVGFVSLAIALPFAFPVALGVSVPSRKIVLMVGAMALVVDVAVAVEAGAGVQRLAIHFVWLPEATAWVLISSYDGTEARLYEGRGEKGEGGRLGLGGLWQVWRAWVGSGEK